MKLSRVAAQHVCLASSVHSQPLAKRLLIINQCVSLPRKSIPSGGISVKIASFQTQAGYISTKPRFSGSRFSGLVCATHWIP